MSKRSWYCIADAKRCLPNFQNIALRNGGGVECVVRNPPDNSGVLLIKSIFDGFLICCGRVELVMTLQVGWRMRRKIVKLGKIKAPRCEGGGGVINPCSIHG